MDVTGKIRRDSITFLTLILYLCLRRRWLYVSKVYGPQSFRTTKHSHQHNPHHPSISDTMHAVLGVWNLFKGSMFSFLLYDIRYTTYWRRICGRLSLILKSGLRNSYSVKYNILLVWYVLINFAVECHPKFSFWPLLLTNGDQLRLDHG